jgi:hypothetical protein
MPIDFDAILKDDKSFPDNWEIPFGNEKVTLGSIRDLTRKQQQAVAEQLGAMQREREAISTRQREYEEGINKTNSIYQNLQQQVEANKAEAERSSATKQTGGYDPEQMYNTDIWYGPIRKRDQKLEEDMRKVMERLDLVSRVQSAMGDTYIADRFDNEFESTAEQRKRSKQISDWDLERFKKYAQENKIADKRGLYSIREAVNKLTQGERTQEEADSAYQRGLREGEMRARMGVQPRPGAANAAMPNGGAQPKDLDEALSVDSISQDEELMRMLGELQSQGANLLTGGK